MELGTKNFSILKFISYIVAVIIAFLVIEEIKKMRLKNAIKKGKVNNVSGGSLGMLPTGEVVETMPTYVESEEEAPRSFEQIKPSRTIIY